MAGYIRVDTSNNIADGNVISAADLDNEFDGVQAGFNASTGHTHGGAAGEGAPITKLGPAQDVTISTSLMAPKTTNTVDLGSSSLRYKDLFLAGNATIAGTLGVTGVATLGAGAILNTPASVTLTNATGLPISTGVSGLGTGVATALAVNVGSAGAPVLFNGALGTPSSGTVTNLTGTASININGTVGATTANTGAFTTLSASSTVSGTGFSNYLASPPAIGGTTAAAVSATTLTTSSTVTHNGGTANGVTYLNGSKVLTSGSALTFDGSLLNTTGSIRAQNNLFVYGTGDRLNIFPQAAGSGVQLLVTNNANTDYAPLSFDGSRQVFSLFGGEQMRLTSTGLGIGTSSPAAKLNVKGGDVISLLADWNSKSNAMFELANPAVRFGIGYDSSDQVLLQGFGSNNAVRNIGIQVYGGNLGIGTASPGYKLEVRGGALAVGNGTIATGFSYDSGGIVTTFSNHDLRFGTNNSTPTMVLNTSGNLGLGVTPSAWQGSGPGQTALQTMSWAVSNDVNSSYQTNNAVYSAGAWRYISSKRSVMYQLDSASGNQSWHTAPSGTAGNAISFTQAMTLDASGNLGIGTSSPNQLVDVRGASSPTVKVRNTALGIGNISQLLFEGSNSFSGTSTSFIQSISLNSGNSSTALVFGTNADGGGAATERARIDSSGNLLVGVTIGSVHRIYKTNNTGEALQIQNNSTTSGSRCLELTLLTNGDAAGSFIRCGDSGAYRFYVLGNGNALNSNGSYGTISDAKLKENVTDATPKLEKLNQVRVVNYNLIGDEQKQIGVIAQELEQIFPGMVDEIIDRDQEGNDLGTTTKSVKMSVFVPMLIKAMQEQQAIITALTARITALETN